jgi:nucleotide-binding universal stress UspA family protein
MTPTIRKILLPVDFSVPSERAAGYAAVLARSLGASIHLVHALENPAIPAGPWRFDPRHEADRRERLYHEARTRLAAVAATLRDGERRVSAEVRIGHAADEITEAAVDYGCDLIVMATHGRSGLPHLLMGSVAEAVIRRAACPVLTVRQSGAAQVARGQRVA